MTDRGPIPPELDDLDLHLRQLLIYAEQAG